MKLLSHLFFHTVQHAIDQRHISIKDTTLHTIDRIFADQLCRRLQTDLWKLRRAGSPVRVCALCPGPVDTEFNKVAGVRFSLSGLSAERVARAAIDGLLAGKAVVVPGAAMKAMTLARHFAPDSILARITYHFQHKKGAK